MAKVTEIQPKRQYEHTYKDDQCVMVWKYDLDKSTSGPISVDIKWNADVLKEMNNPNKKAEGKLGELHDAFAKIDAQRKKKKKPKPNDISRFW